MCFLHIGSNPKANQNYPEIRRHFKLKLVLIDTSGLPEWKHEEGKRKQMMLFFSLVYILNK